MSGSKGSKCCHDVQIPRLGSLGSAAERGDDSFAELRRLCKDGGIDCDTIHYSVPRTNQLGEQQRSGKVTFFGDVQWVIQGTPDHDKVQQVIDASSVRYGFEAGTTAPPGDDNAHGEMVAFNSQAYVKSTRTGSSEFYKTVYGPYLRCEAAGFIGPADAVPDLVASTTLGGMTWTSAVNDMFENVQTRCGAVGAAFGGMVHFERLQGVAIALPTTAHENIFEAKEKYYPFAPHVEHNVHCVVVGFVADMRAAEKKGVTGLDKVLYKGASGSAGGGADSSLTLHTHLVTLRRSCRAQTAQAVQPQDVKEVYHLDSSSIVASFNLEMWLIDQPLQEHPTLPSDSMPRSMPSPTPAKCNCSEWVVNALVDAGVTHIFGGHGGALVPLVNAVCKHPKVTWICNRNEANSSLMAAAHAKLTGNLGVCIATSGPGAANLTTGLLDGLQDQCPMIAITGLKPRAGIGYSEFQDLQQSRLFAGGGLPMSLDVHSPDALIPLLRDAVAKALTLRTCVHLAVPVDVQAADSPVPLKPFCAADARDELTLADSHSYLIRNVASELSAAVDRGSGRVVIAVGHRAVDAGEEILQLAERLSAPVLTRLDAKGCVDESHPLAFGVIGVHGKSGLEKATRIIETAQLVISIGNHDDTLLLCNRAGLQIRPVIKFEPDAMCLRINARYRALYDVVGDVKYMIKRLLEAMKASQSLAESPSLAESWARELAYSGMDMTSPPDAATLHLVSGAKQAKLEIPEEHKKLWDCVRDGNFRKASKQCNRFRCLSKVASGFAHPATVMEEMSSRMGGQDVLCVDVGDVTLWASLSACLTKGQRTLSSERLGTMGYGICAGIAACLERGASGRACVVLGDGGAQMTINELGTARYIFQQAEHKLLLVILDNATLGRVAFGFEGALGCDLGPSPDFVMLARAYGGDGIQVSSCDELPGAMDTAFKSTGIFVLHVVTDPELKADMATFQDTSINMMNSG
ncbi:unnamed protein product [Effrenium voratum]|uniref:Pyruvate decarboxylase n=1 Tax=Effrenium voratum TaxID=2562239 RepID=A0AA36N051_9DINO|nr:unnamed protein product [Effrenium voratum]CAJ1420867.1 unnamed protein product [Effrenium voratum]